MCTVNSGLEKYVHGNMRRAEQLLIFPFKTLMAPQWDRRKVRVEYSMPLFLSAQGPSPYQKTSFQSLGTACFAFCFQFFTTQSLCN